MSIVHESSNVFVKEEYIIEEVDPNFCKAQTRQDNQTKCGEVFKCSTGYNLTFVCTQCLQGFADLPSFGEHIWNTHPSVETDDTNATNDPVALEEPAKTLKDPIRLPPVKVEHVDDTVQNEDENFEDDHVPDQLEDTDFVNSKEKSGSESSEDDMFPPEKPKKRNRGQKYCCFSCSITFGNLVRYRKHYRTEHPDMIEKDESDSDTGFKPKPPETMTCKYCLKTFEDPTTFHEHLVKDHSTITYTCTKCPKIFRYRNERDRHLDAHEHRKRFGCPHCPKMFSHPTNVYTHIKSHLNIKNHTCRFCGHKFVRGSDLRIHERIHTNERPYQCEECGMSFIAQTKLTNHMRRHNNIKKYNCEFCEKTFFASSTLKNHIRTHTREKPYTCKVCNKTFRAAGNLRSHMQLHSDVKKYVCRLCGKSFAQHSGLYSHMKSH